MRSIYLIALVFSPFTPCAAECTTSEQCDKNDETSLMQMNVNVHKPSNAIKSIPTDGSKDSEMIDGNTTEDDEITSQICGDNVIKVSGAYYRRTNAHNMNLGNLVIKDSYVDRGDAKDNTHARVWRAGSAEHWLGEMCRKVGQDGFVFKDALKEKWWPFSSKAPKKANAPAPPPTPPHPAPPLPKPDPLEEKYVKKMCTPRETTCTLTLTQSQERSLEASASVGAAVGPSGSLSGKHSSSGSKESAYPFKVLTLQNHNLFGDLLKDDIYGAELARATLAAEDEANERKGQILRANEHDTKHGWHAPGWMRSLAGKDPKLRDAANDFEVGARVVTAVLVATAETKEVESGSSSNSAAAKVSGIMGIGGGGFNGSTSSSHSNSASMGAGTTVAYALHRMVTRTNQRTGQTSTILVLDDPCDTSGDGMTVNKKDCVKCGAIKGSMFR